MEKSPRHSRYPGLEVEEDLAQERIEWLVQGIAWPLCYLLIIAIALGITGGGWLSEAVLENAGGTLWMEYQRFLHHRTADTLHFRLHPEAGTATLLIDRQYLRAVELRRVTPTPARVTSKGDAAVFVFSAEAGEPVVSAALYIEPQEVGRLAGWVAVPGKAHQSFEQFVYP